MDFDKNIKQLKWEIINLGFEVYKFIHPESMPQFKYIITEVTFLILKCVLLTSQYQSNGRIPWILWNIYTFPRSKYSPNNLKD